MEIRVNAYLRLTGEPGRLVMLHHNCAQGYELPLSADEVRPLAEALLALAPPSPADPLTTLCGCGHDKGAHEAGRGPRGSCFNCWCVGFRRG